MMKRKTVYACKQLPGSKHEGLTDEFTKPLTPGVQHRQNKACAMNKNN
jgi:hypothetical protein